MSRHEPTVIAEYQNGKLVNTGHPLYPGRNNFVVVCEVGDWSGFRKLSECMSIALPLRRDGYYWIEERF